VCWQTKRAPEAHDASDKGEERQAHGEEREVQMRVPNLPLHVERMAHWIEAERVQDQSLYAAWVRGLVSSIR
jgi:hypothetical protein